MLVSPTREEFLRLSRQGNVVPVHADLLADLETPVSAYAKLASFRPRFLLESVEGGERLGRYSFIGFGEGLEVRLDSRSLTIGPHAYPVPGSKEALLQRLREALARAPRPQPELPGVPLAGGLVGSSVGLLMAPQSGSATREAARSRLRDTTDSVRGVKQRAERRGEEIRDEAARRVGAAASALVGNGTDEIVAG